ncbi:unnamed protein product, partial [Candidula unifasciata]
MISCVNDTPPAAAGLDQLDVTLGGLISQLQKSFRTLEQSANLCLISLAVSDLMFCIFALLTMFLPADNVYEEHGILLIYGVYSAAIINVFIMDSTMLTVAMSLERYLAICFPLRQDIYLTTRRIKFVIVFTFIFSVVFNIPVLWRQEIVTFCIDWSNDIHSNTNMTEGNSSFRFADYKSEGNVQPLWDVVTTVTTSTTTLFPAVVNASLTTPTNIPCNKTTPSVSTSHVFSINHSTTETISRLPQTSTVSRPTEPGFSFQKSEPDNSGIKTLYTTRIVPFAGNQIYDNAYRLVWAFVGNFIPLLLLLYFNVCLFRKIYRSYKLRKQLGRQDRTKSSSHVLTITLVAIVVLFFILVAPSEVTLQISFLTNSQDTPMLKNIEAVLNLMQSINFSVNFILYCIISPHFRKTLKYMMLCGCYRFYQVSKTWKKDFETSL